MLHTTQKMLHTTQKAQAVTAAVRTLTQSAELCRGAGLAVAIVSCGGTGTNWFSAVQPGVTEIQAGGGVFGDVHCRKDYGVDHPYALTLMTTVTSRPTAHRIVCDAGKKAMSGDTALPVPIGIGPTRQVRLSAEHAIIELEAPVAAPPVGEHLEFVVGYSDTTVHLHETLYGVRSGRIEAVWPIQGRCVYRKPKPSHTGEEARPAADMIGSCPQAEQVEAIHHHQSYQIRRFGRTLPSFMLERAGAGYP